MELPRRIKPPRPIGTTARVMTLQGLIKLRDDLQGEDSRSGSDGA